MGLEYITLIQAVYRFACGFVKFWPEIKIHPKFCLPLCYAACLHHIKWNGVQFGEFVILLLLA
jgi:hypothetical protein